MPPPIAHALFWVTVAACAVGQGALLWMAVRRWERRTATYESDRRSDERRLSERWSPDRRSGAGSAAAADDSGWRELAWSVLPAIGLALLLAATWAALP